MDCSICCYFLYLYPVRIFAHPNHVTPRNASLINVFQHQFLPFFPVSEIIASKTPVAYKFLPGQISQDLPYYVAEKPVLFVIYHAETLSCKFMLGCDWHV